MGKIILLNTPIGNLGDLTPRVLEALTKGEVFAVEDTRVFRELLNHVGVSLNGKRILSLHDQSEDSQVGKLLEFLGGGDLYVASEAGSPIVSDPAYPLVIAAYERGIEVESFSGVSSPIMALGTLRSSSHPFPVPRLLAEGEWEGAKSFNDTGYGTHIFFEAPTRIEETLDELAQLHPHFQVALVRELSKKFQQVVRFKAGEWPEKKKEVMFKGEFVLMFHRQEAVSQLGAEIKTMATEMLSGQGGPKSLAKLLGAILDRPTKDIYSELTRQKK